jgi:DNA-binding NarL/FixJ family response regulator
LIRIAIIADTIESARRLKTALDRFPDLEIVEATSLESAGPTRVLERADVIVADHVPVRELPASGPPVVMIGSETNPGQVFRDSVRAWLPPDLRTAELVAAIVSASEDLTTLTQEQVGRLLSPSGSANPGGTEVELVESLTPRELQVLRGLADGLGNKEIGEWLSISDHTAKFHVAQILGKLGAGSRAEAVAIGIRRGLIPI